ncbi:MAG: replication-associated recombination protein A [Deltaproteobacteria bacterium]|nr:replication-associated recombination protein A [Deltaproteobacteria bacterium]
MEKRDLFTLAADQRRFEQAPLAEKMRPQTLDEFVGQRHIVASGQPLHQQILKDEIPSLILWGPPGSGKTTLARIIAHQTKASFHGLSAVLSGVKELREIIEMADGDLRLHNQKTILFIDEIHRWNKAQQDALLPHIENGTIILIGATTENPSFEVISPLLSRTKIYTLQPLSVEELRGIIERAVKNQAGIELEEEALRYLIATSDGDARRALNTLEIAMGLLPKNQKKISLQTVEQAVQKKSLLYDKSGEEHYNLISAFIKSMRGSDPDAAIYYLARMLEAGEEPLFLARRMVIFASEDVGNADPQAIQVAISAMQAFDFVGLPEGWIPLAQCATYLASAPKSNASYSAYKKAKADIEETGYQPVPKNLRNAPTKLMKEEGYGKGYQYPHDFEKNYIKEEYLPEKLRSRKYYEPTENGYEKEIRRHLEGLKKK